MRIHNELNWRIIIIVFVILAVIELLIRLTTKADQAWFGIDNFTNSWGVATGYADAQRFQAPENGTSNRIEIFTWGEVGSGLLRMAVYDDSVSHPNHKLWEGTNINYIPTDWRGEDVSTIQITANTYYWFAFKTSTTEVMCYKTGSLYEHEWKGSQPFANTFPDPWGSYTGHNYNRYTMRMFYTTGEGETGIIKGIIEDDRGIIEGKN